MTELATGALGVLAILFAAFLLSTNRRAIRPRVVLSAFVVQAAMAAFVLYVPFGKTVVATLSDGVHGIIAYSRAGIDMVFGPLASDKVGFSVAIHVLPIVIFFSSLMSVLYHIGIMQLVVNGVGGLLRFIIGTGRVESLNAAANIFVGQTEAPLAVRPYLKNITGPQLFTILTSGMASVSGSILAAYAQFGIKLEYLLAAAFMSAPGGLLMAKIIMPDEPGKAGVDQDIIKITDKSDKHTNVIMAAAVGARDGLMLAANIAAMLIAFVALIALINGGIGLIGRLAGIDNLTAQLILGYIFAPLMYLLNVPWSEVLVAGGIFGEKVILNEFIAYVSLGDIQSTLSPKTVAVLTFALCGFANLGSIAILLGGLGSLIPERMPQIAAFGLRALAAASLSNLMSAALAGLLFHP